MYKNSALMYMAVPVVSITTFAWFGFSNEEDLAKKGPMSFVWYLLCLLFMGYMFLGEIEWMC